MSLRAYVDTNVFIDFFEDRDSAAYRFLVKAVGCSYQVVISTLTIKELQLRCTNDTIQNTLRLLAQHNKLEQIDDQEADSMLTKKLVNRGVTHSADARHIVLAERSRVDLIVTKNVKDFVNATNIRVESPAHI
jgi:predicted nucleic acid-binding protein